MADKDLQTILSSGDITSINKGGTASTDAILKKGENDAIYQDLAGAAAIIKTKFTPQPSAPAHIEGQQYYNSTDETMRIQGPFDGVEVSVGHGLHTHVVNNSGGLIEKGSAVRHNGVILGKVQVVKAIATSFVFAEIFGVASADILDTEEGAITTFGEIKDLDTSLFNDGVPLYLSDTVAGEWVEVAPDIISQVGGATLSDASGVLFVSIINNKNLPNIFGGMQGQTLGNETYSLTATVQDIINYDTESSKVVVVDVLNGLITLPNDGGYRVHVTANITFLSSTSTRTVYVELYDVTGVELQFTYAKNIPRNATEDSLGFSWPISELAGNQHKLRIRANTPFDVTFQAISFDIDSVNIT